MKNLANDLNNMYGIDIVQQMESILVKELSDSINKQIRNQKRYTSINKIFKSSE